METDFKEFSALLEELFEPQFNFDHRNLESWTSMQALIVVSAIDEHYNVLISHEELKQAQSLEDLHEILQKKLQ